MIHFKTDEEINTMKESCQLAAEVLIMIEPYVKPGVTTERLDQICHDYIISHGAVPSPLNYRGFPKSICSSVNEEICHGIPSSRKLRNGDIVNLDITTYLKGFHGDTSRTFFVGSPRKQAEKLVEVCKEALQKGIECVKPGGRLGDIGATIQQLAEGHGYSVVREFCGHGIGSNFHEEPQILHYGQFGEGLERWMYGQPWRIRLARRLASKRYNWKVRARANAWWRSRPAGFATPTPLPSRAMIPKAFFPPSWAMKGPAWWWRLAPG